MGFINTYLSPTGGRSTSTENADLSVLERQNQCGFMQAIEVDPNCWTVLGLV
jgi:hypothetical protein